jgi:transcriptional regulator with XRE-family HTH domain
MTYLREARAEQLLSIRELARRARVSASTIYLTEAGRTIPQPGVVRRLCAALGVEPSEVAEFRRAIEASKLPVGSIRGLARRNGAQHDIPGAPRAEEKSDAAG